MSHPAHCDSAGLAVLFLLLSYHDGSVLEYIRRPEQLWFRNAMRSFTHSPVRQVSGAAHTHTGLDRILPQGGL